MRVCLGQELNIDCLFIYLFLDFGKDIFEGFEILDCQLSEHLAVERDFGLLQLLDEARIVEGVASGVQGGADTSDPQAAHVAFAQLTTDVSVLASVQQCFFGAFVEAAVGATETLG